VSPDTNYDELKATIQGFAKSAVMIRLDTPGRNQTDGASEAFDWAIAEKLQAEGIPVIVAGGLNPKNVKDLVEKTKVTYAAYR
jgi:anthranilate synthase/indole-3-glycerol phosphate synthase/phosphoribosylanthranilate isomerase